MPRMLRTILDEGVFHIWTVAVDGTPAFADDDDRFSFLRLFGECVHCYEWEVYAWCLLTTHYHLLIGAKQPMLSAGMQRLNGLHAQRVNRRRERKGHVFRARFSSRETTTNSTTAKATRTSWPAPLSRCQRGSCA